MATATLTRLREQQATIGTGRVDRDAGVIRGVRVLGRVSKNGREYSTAARNDVARLAEGRRVMVNHPDRRNPNVERSIADHFGVLRNVRRDGEAIAGDLHYVKSHPLAPQIVEMAESQPDQLGLSINAEGSVERRDGRNIVEEVSRLRSVDLVLEPATNRNLFEQVPDEEPGVPQLAGALADRLAQGEASAESLEAVQVVLAGFVVLATKAESGAGRKVDRLKREIDRFMSSAASTLGIDRDEPELADQSEEERKIDDAIDSGNGPDGRVEESWDAPSWSPDYVPPVPVPRQPQRSTALQEAMREYHEREEENWLPSFAKSS